MRMLNGKISGVDYVVMYMRKGEVLRRLKEQARNDKTRRIRETHEQQGHLWVVTISNQADAEMIACNSMIEREKLEKAHSTITYFHMLYKPAWKAWLVKRLKEGDPGVSLECPIKLLRMTATKDPVWREAVHSAREAALMVKRRSKAGFDPVFSRELFDEACKVILRNYYDGNLPRPTVHQLIKAGIIDRASDDYTIRNFYVKEVAARIDYKFNVIPTLEYDESGSIRFSIPMRYGDGLLYIAQGESYDLCGIFHDTDDLDQHLDEKCKIYFR